MKFTISDCMSRINQALNYPAISYEDVSHFFDQAVSELNSILRISLPTVSEMRAEHTFSIADSDSTIVISKDVTTKEIPKASAIDNGIPQPGEGENTDSNIYYYVATKNFERCFYIKKGDSWVATPKAYGIVPGGAVAYETVAISGYAVWYETPLNKLSEFSLTEYLPVDWIILFLIPYVCFKFAVRNGDNGALFSDEFTQGLQQLQTSYSVPTTVALSSVVHLAPYSAIAAANLNNLSKHIPTRAITESMKIPNGVHAVYGNIFDHGGWGI